MPELTIGTLVLTAVVLAVSAASKLRSRAAYREYRLGLGQTRLIGTRRLPLVAAVLAVAEASIACALLTSAVVLIAAGPSGRMLVIVSLGAGCTLMIVLAAGVGTVIRRGVQARCPCFGSSQARPLGASAFARNLVILAALAVGLGTAAAAAPRPSVAAAGLAALTGLVGGLLLTRWDDFADLLAPMPGPGLPASAPPPRRTGH